MNTLLALWMCYFEQLHSDRTNNHYQTFARTEGLNGSIALLIPTFSTWRSGDKSDDISILLSRSGRTRLEGFFIPGNIVQS